MSSICSLLCWFNVENINELGVPLFKLYHAKHYTTSKLCLTLYAIALAKRLKGTGVNVYSLHPGVIKTKIFYIGGIFERVVLFFLHILCKVIL